MRFYTGFHTVVPVLHACHKVIFDIISVRKAEHARGADGPTCSWKKKKICAHPVFATKLFHSLAREWNNTGCEFQVAHLIPGPLQVASTCPLKVPSKSAQVPRSKQKQGLPKPAPTCKIELPFHRYALFSVTPPFPQKQS